MKEIISNVRPFPGQTVDALSDILRQGAQNLLTEAIQAEISDYIERYRDLKDSSGRRLVVRNGSMPEREIQTSLGQIPIKQPRINDRRVDSDGNRIRFESKILPPYLRRTKNIEELIPWLYLKGISTGDFTDALSAILGKDAPGLSATTITRLKEGWQKDYEKWCGRRLDTKRYIYIWADGIHFNVRLGEDERMCLLVIIGATLEGKKEVLAIESGYRESALSWKNMLLELRSRGLTTAPELAVGDGALGFWSALEEIYPTTECQRCWVHKTANILDKLPRSRQVEAKKMIHDIYMAATKADAEAAIDRFTEVHSAKYEKATECLLKDREKLLAFYKFPAEHWQHIRTTNPIESMFATVRHRTQRTKGCGSTSATLTMVFKLALCAEKRWHKLRGSKLLADVIDARFMFVDGLRKERAA